MKTVRDIIAEWSARLLANPERVQHIGAIYKLTLHGEGGGSWRLQCRTPVTIEEGEGPADCAVSMAAVDFIALMEKKLNPQVAFLSGKMTVTGNVTLALKLAELA